MAEHASIVRLTRFQPASGQRDELIRRLVEGAEGVRQMEGCFGAQICTARESPDVIVAVSRWASQAALDRFLQQSASQQADLAKLAASPPASEHLISVTPS
jgi:quinol monooxygenase YgiN